jgi:hypothetical protein
MTLDDIREEADAAERRYGPFASTHEAFGVLAEEQMELLAAIHANDLEAIRREAVQCAAVALRLAELCDASEADGYLSSFRVRSGIR